MTTVTRCQRRSDHLDHPITPIGERATVEVSGSITDPGRLDIVTATEPGDCIAAVAEADAGGFRVRGTCEECINDYLTLPGTSLRTCQRGWACR